MKKIIKTKKILKNLIDVFLDIIKIFYFSLSNLILYRKLIDTNLTVVTGSDFTHFDSIINLLKSISLYEPNSKIVVYNLGFYDSQLTYLEDNYKNIEIITFDFDKYPSFFSERSRTDNKLGSYAWKSAIVNESLKKYGGSVLWLDAGDLITKKLTLLKIVLTSVGVYVPKSAGKIFQWTHEKTISKFDFKDLDQNKRNLASGMIGFNSNKKIAVEIVDKWLESSKSEDLIAPKGSSRLNHRQDQSLLTLICYRLKVVKRLPSSHKIFGIIVHQDPGKIYLSPVNDQKLQELRSNWYQLHIDLSTNTLLNADIVCLLDFTSIKDFPVKYLEKVYLICLINDDDKSLNREIFEKYKQYIDHIFFVDKTYIKNFEISDLIKKTNYQEELFSNELLKIVKEQKNLQNK